MNVVLAMADTTIPIQQITVAVRALQPLPLLLRATTLPTEIHQRTPRILHEAHAVQPPQPVLLHVQPAAVRPWAALVTAAAEEAVSPAVVAVDSPVEVAVAEAAAVAAEADNKTSMLELSVNNY